eukprot:gene25059-10710_t
MIPILAFACSRARQAIPANMAHLARNSVTKPHSSAPIRREFRAISEFRTSASNSPHVRPELTLAASHLALGHQTKPLFNYSVRSVSTDVPKEEKFQYQAEVDRLMDMIVNSLYSNREVFLRELVSNASDALDKIRFLSVTSPDMMKDREELVIKISADKNNRTITID